MSVEAGAQIFHYLFCSYIADQLCARHALGIVK